MAYHVYLAQYVHQGPADNTFVNTWHFATANTQAIDNTTLGITEGNKVFNPLFEFYNDWASAGMSGVCNNAGSGIKIYDVTAGPPYGAPVYSYLYNVNPYATTSSAPGLPWEVACCLSFEAFAAPGTVRARRRGRVYLGPLTQDAIVEGGGLTVYIADVFSAAVLDAYKTMVDSLLANGYETGPYSYTDQIALPVATAWVDDAPDTQRRRGQRPQARITVERLPDNTAWV